MTVLPNSFERYTAALRILTSLLILKHGNNKKYLRNLSKIYIAESYYLKDFLEPLNIKNFALSLFCAAAVLKYKHKRPFHFKVNTNKNFVINKNIFAVLILNLCKDCERIYIETTKNNIIIDFKGNHKKSLSALKMLKGFYFYSINSKSGKFIIPAKQTNEKSVVFPNEWENIFNRFSTVNLFFENII